LRLLPRGDGMNDIAANEVIERFIGLLQSFDFEEECRILEIGKLHMVKRRNALRELKALYIGLWKIALDKSLPDRAEEIFHGFIERIPEALDYNDKAASFLRRRIAVYDTLLEPTKEQNFNEVSAKLLGSVTKRKELKENQVLKLSLHVRKVYTLLFKKLIP